MSDIDARINSTVKEMLEVKPLEIEKIAKLIMLGNVETEAVDIFLETASCYRKSAPVTTWCVFSPESLPLVARNASPEVIRALYAATGEEDWATRAALIALPQSSMWFTADQAIKIADDFSRAHVTCGEKNSWDVVAKAIRKNPPPGLEARVDEIISNNVDRDPQYATVFAMMAASQEKLRYLIKKLMGYSEFERAAYLAQYCEKPGLRKSELMKAIDFYVDRGLDSVGMEAAIKLFEQHYREDVREYLVSKFVKVGKADMAVRAALVSKARPIPHITIKGIVWGFMMNGNVVEAMKAAAYRQPDNVLADHEREFLYNAILGRNYAVPKIEFC